TPRGLPARGPRPAPGSETLSFQKILQYKPDVRWSFSQSPHEIRIPVFAVRYVHAHPPTITRQLFLQVAPNPVKHLEFKSILRDSLLLRKIYRGVDHLRIVHRNAMIGPAGKQQLHDADVIRIDVLLLRIGDTRRFVVCAFAEAYPRRNL